MAKFTCIVIGAGLAGLSAAYSLAAAGVDVLVVERGEYPGSKNVSGGRIYLNPVRDLYPELWREAPWERHISREALTLVNGESSLTVDLNAGKFNREPYQSFTILRSKFDRWFAQKAAAKGARIINKYKVDDLLIENGRVKGVVVGGAALNADVVIGADGAISRIAEIAGLGRPRLPETFALGVKEVIEIGENEVNKRFQIRDNAGLARLFIGSLTRGLFGAGFLYTNRSSISLGLVLRIKDLVQANQETPYDLLEDFKRHPDIAPLIEGGESVEYAAHLLCESGIKGMPRLFGDGILLAGDAAGMSLNMGLTVRGMEYALMSGSLAAKTIKIAKDRNDFSAAALAQYNDLVKSSFIWRDLKSFGKAPELLDNPRLFREYPQRFCRLAEDLFTVGPGPKERFLRTARRHLDNRTVLRLIKDGFRLRKM